MIRYEVFRKSEFKKDRGDGRCVAGYLGSFSTKEAALEYANKYASSADQYHDSVIICRVQYDAIVDISRTVTINVSTKDL